MITKVRERSRYGRFCNQLHLWPA